MLQYTSFQNCNAFNIHRTATSIAMVLRLVLLGQLWILSSAATVGPALGGGGQHGMMMKLLNFHRCLWNIVQKLPLSARNAKTTHPVFMINLPAYYFCSLAVCMFPLVLRHSSVSSFCAPADIKHFATSRSGESLWAAWTPRDLKYL